MNIRTSNRLTDLSARIRQASDRAKVASLEAAEQYLEAGRLLIEAKSECPHGDWLPFLVNCEVSERQAQRLMQLARSGMKSDTVSDLGGVKAALTHLAEQKRPEPIDIDTDEDGDQITSCVVMPTEGEETAKMRPRVTGQAAVALRLLRKAVDEGGEPAPASNHIVTKNHIVTLSLWRRYCYAGTVTDSGSEAAKRQAFHRCVTRLQEAQAIDIWDEYVWIND